MANRLSGTARRCRSVQVVAPLICQLFALAACAQAGPDRADERQVVRPNVVVLIADDISHGDFGCTGSPSARTPHIDALAAEGTVYERAFLTTSSCSPSRASILSGRYPHNTGAAELHLPLPGQVPTVAEHLGAGGYFTGAAGKWHLGQAARADFDTIISRGNGPSGAERFVDLLRARPLDRPFFAWLAAVDAHRSWDDGPHVGTTDPATVDVPPYQVDDSVTRADYARYFDEVHRFDDAVGAVVDELQRQGVLEETVVVVMADNGRPFPRDKTRLFDSGIQTPFIVRWPAGGVQAGARSRALLSVVDLAPTIAELAGLPRAQSYQGRSFATALRDPDAEHRAAVFAEHNWHDYRAFGRMIRTPEALLIVNGLPGSRVPGAADVHGSPSFRAMVEGFEAGTLGPAQAEYFEPGAAIEYYDTRADPLQLRNLAADERSAGRRDSLLVRLEQWRVATADAQPDDLTADHYDFLTAEPVIEMDTYTSVRRGTHPGEPTARLTAGGE